MSGRPGGLAIPWATSTRNPSTPRSSQNRRMRANSAATSGFVQSRSGCSGANRCRYHWPGVPSAAATRCQAEPPKRDGQLFGGSSPPGPRPSRKRNRARSGAARARPPARPETTDAGRRSDWGRCRPSPAGRARARRRPARRSRPGCRSRDRRRTDRTRRSRRQPSASGRTARATARRHRARAGTAVRVAARSGRRFRRRSRPGSCADRPGRRRRHATTRPVRLVHSAASGMR